MEKGGVYIIDLNDNSMASVHQLSYKEAIAIDVDADGDNGGDIAVDETVVVLDLAHSPIEDEDKIINTSDEPIS